MRLFCTQEEEEYWMGEPIYEEDKSIGFHRLWFLNVLSRKNDFDLSLQSPDGYFTKRTAWSELDHEKKLKAYIIHRTLLCNEIIFDFDAKNYETNVHYFKSKIRNSGRNSFKLGRKKFNKLFCSVKIPAMPH